MADTIAPQTASNSFSYRNVPACNRCRLRKTRCDQRLPACGPCERAGVRCVGYDPITKREIPRSYVFFLEARVASLEADMIARGLPVKPVEAYDAASPSLSAQKDAQGDAEKWTPPADGEGDRRANNMLGGIESERLNKLVSNVGMASVQGASDPGYLGFAPGISFARVVFAAVKSASNTSDKGSTHETVRPSTPAERQTAGAGSPIPDMRNSFFGLALAPPSEAHETARLPDRGSAVKLAEAYFSHVNPQFPILHRDEFMSMLHIVYAIDERSRTPRQSYFLFMVFEIGLSVERILSPKSQLSPEKYYISAMSHSDEMIASRSNREEGYGDNLEELQAVLLLALLALFRPITPGLWYIVGVAVRLAVDLGLYHEEGRGSALSGHAASMGNHEDISSEPAREGEKEIGRRLWVRDMRRRLLWCTYSLDRLVGVAVSRPLSLPEEVVTTPFPSLLDDAYISTTGISSPAEGTLESYEKVSIHNFRLRLLQSEILQVLQNVQAANTITCNKDFDIRKPSDWQSPFLAKFDSFRSWRIDMDKRLWQWKQKVPTRSESGVKLAGERFDLEYWKSVILLYRQSLAIPEDRVLGGTFSGLPSDIESPSMYAIELRRDDEELLKLAEASQKVMRIYRQLNRVNLVFYTFLDTNSLFIAGISFLYSIWHSPILRSRLTMDEVDFTILACTSVLGDLIPNCPPAAACRDAFERMSKATVQMAMSTTGFSSSANPVRLSQPDANSSSPNAAGGIRAKRRQSKSPPAGRPRQIPKFDMSLRDLLSADFEASDFTRGDNVSRLEQVPGLEVVDFGMGGYGDQDLEGDPGLDLFEGFFFGGSGNF